MQRRATSVNAGGKEAQSGARLARDWHDARMQLALRAADTPTLMRRHDESDAGRVGTIELFFRSGFVFAVTQLCTTLATDLSITRMLQAKFAAARGIAQQHQVRSRASVHPHTQDRFGERGAPDLNFLRGAPVLCGRNATIRGSAYRPPSASAYSGQRGVHL